MKDKLHGLQHERRLVVLRMRSLLMRIERHLNGWEESRPPSRRMKIRMASQNSITDGDRRL